MRISFFYITLFFITFFSYKAICQEKTRKPIRTLIIDPGHGGLDPGAVGTKESEANVALQVSLKLGQAISKAYPDIKVIYTRTTDILPGNMPNKDAALKYRANLANESGGDLFIAVHCNSAGRHPGGWYSKKSCWKNSCCKNI